jgi:hypothetical protein
VDINGCGLVQMENLTVVALAASTTTPLINITSAYNTNFSVRSLHVKFGGSGTITLPYASAIVNANGSTIATNSNGDIVGYDSLTHYFESISAASIVGPLATDAVKGVMEGDGSTIECTAGVCSASVTAATNWSAITQGANTATGAFSTTAPWTYTFAPAASTPNTLINGGPYTGGSATTNWGELEVDGSSSVTHGNLSTSGTMVNVDAATGFGGNFVACQINGASPLCSINNNGLGTFGGGLSAGENTTISWASSTKLSAIGAAGNLQISGATAGTTSGYLQFGGSLIEGTFTATTALSGSTAPTNPSGNTWTYTFNATQSAAGSNAWVGGNLTISGYTGGATGNNGTFIVTASSTTTVSVTNASGVVTNTGTPLAALATAALQYSANTVTANLGNSSVGANLGVGLGGLFETTHGSNATAGVVTLASGTATVSTTAIAALAAAGGAGDVIVLTLQSCSTCGTLSVGTVTPGTSFVINSTNVLDASNVYWEIKKLN